MNDLPHFSKFSAIFGIIAGGEKAC